MALLHDARATFTEHFLAAAIRRAVKDKANIESSKSLCNNQVKSWSAVSISFDDIHNKVWKHVQQITAGQQPHD